MDLDITRELILHSVTVTGGEHAAEYDSTKRIIETADSEGNYNGLTTPSGDNIPSGRILTANYMGLGPARGTNHRVKLIFSDFNKLGRSFRLSENSRYSPLEEE